MTNTTTHMTKTPFEVAQLAVKEGRVTPPKVHSGASEIDYFGYQLSVHKFNLTLMAQGMKFRGASFTELKKYYGLKGRSAKDCLPQFLEIVENYKEALK